MPTTVMEATRRVIDALPNRATWEDVKYGLYVREAIEKGLAERDADHVVPADEVRRFGVVG